MRNELPEIVNPKSEHPALWAMLQVCARDIDSCVHVRFVDTQQYNTISLTKNIHIEDLRNEWATWLYEACVSFNLPKRRPHNILFGFNPRTSLVSPKGKASTLYRMVGANLECTNGRTREDCLMAIQCWRDFEMPPSLLIDYQRGICAAWRIENRIDEKAGSVLSAYVIQACGTRRKTKNWDAEDLFPMPGFFSYYRENFTQRNRRLCQSVTTILHPPENERFNLHGYSVESFQALPPVKPKDIRRYYSYVEGLPGGSPESIRSIAAMAKKLAHDQMLPTLAGRMAMDNDTEKAVYDPNISEKWEPTLPAMPHVDDIRLNTNWGWVHLYLKRGFENVTEFIMRDISRFIGIENPTPQDIEFEVVRYFTKKGYTAAAIHEFVSRKNVHFTHGSEAEIKSFSERAIRQLKAMNPK